MFKITTLLKIRVDYGENIWTNFSCLGDGLTWVFIRGFQICEIFKM